MEQWMMSNQQPWVEALLRGFITTKTRSPRVHLPPVGARVFLHASTTLWPGRCSLSWVHRYSIDVPKLPRGVVVGVADVIAVGPSKTVMPEDERWYFATCDGRSSCAGPVSIRFSNVRKLPPIECRGTQQPTRKLPIQLQNWLDAFGVEYGL